MARILLIDDDEAVRTTVAAMLARMGHVVTTAASGSEGVETARRERFDLVITDLVMPDLDGIEVIRILVGMPDPPKIAVITGGRFDGIDLARALEVLGVQSAALPKPFRQTELLELVEAMLKP